MALVVESEEAEQLAEEIANETGQSVSAVVTQMLRERAARISKPQRKPGIEEILAAVNRISDRIQGPAIDHGEEFYDEHGLPK